MELGLDVAAGGAAMAGAMVDKCSGTEEGAGVGAGAVEGACGGGLGSVGSACWILSSGACCQAISEEKRAMS